MRIYKSFILILLLTSCNGEQSMNNTNIWDENLTYEFFIDYHNDNGRIRPQCDKCNIVDTSIYKRYFSQKYEFYHWNDYQDIFIEDIYEYKNDTIYIVLQNIHNNVEFYKYLVYCSNNVAKYIYLVACINLSPVDLYIERSIIRNGMLIKESKVYDFTQTPVKIDSSLMQIPLILNNKTLN